MDDQATLNIRRDIQALRHEMEAMERRQSLAFWQIIKTTKETGIFIGALPMVYVFAIRYGNEWWALAGVVGAGFAAWLGTIDDRRTIRRIEAQIEKTSTH